MLRKLFISLLILSALTSEGIINLTDILCDPSILTKEVIDIVFGCDGEFTAKPIECLNKSHELKATSTFFSNIKFSNISFKFLSDTTDTDSWFTVTDNSMESVVLLCLFVIVFIAARKSKDKGVVFYHSDLSPPLCYN